MRALEREASDTSYSFLFVPFSVPPSSLPNVMSVFPCPPRTGKKSKRREKAWKMEDWLQEDRTTTLNFQTVSPGKSHKFAYGLPISLEGTIGLVINQSKGGGLFIGLSKRRKFENNNKPNLKLTFPFK